MLSGASFPQRLPLFHQQGLCQKAATVEVSALVMALIFLIYGLGQCNPRKQLEELSEMVLDQMPPTSTSTLHWILQKWQAVTVGETQRVSNLSGERSKIIRFMG